MHPGQLRHRCGPECQSASQSQPVAPEHRRRKAAVRSSDRRYASRAAWRAALRAAMSRCWLRSRLASEPSLRGRGRKPAAC